MNKNEQKKYITTADQSMIQAMEMIDRNAKGILYITDTQGRLMGSLTDGDIRRWILKTGRLSASVSEMVFKHTKYLFEADADRYAEFMDEQQISSVPVVDADLKIVDIIFRHGSVKDRFMTKSTALAGISVVIMAGGKGTRLLPYTRILPKPLIPVDGVPILERILNRFHEFGTQEFFVTVNYKKEIIKSYFSEQKLPYRISYIEEQQPLGTAGSIRLIHQQFSHPVIITNCDILIEANYDKVMRYHMDSGNDMTIVSSLKNMSIPYGVLHAKEQGIITAMEEKPQLSYFINTGMYVVNPEYLTWIPEHTVYHMTDLADRMMQDGRRVGMYPVSENSFLDMGELEEMKKMEARISGGIAE